MFKRIADAVCSRLIVFALLFLGMAIVYFAFGDVLIYAGAVPTTHPRTIGNVTDTHSKNNLGQLYQVSFSSRSLASGEHMKFFIAIATPTFTSSRAHVTIKTIAENEAVVKLYEDTVVHSSGTNVPAYCRNREIADDPELLFYRGSTIASSGTLISEYTISDHVSPEPEIKQEWVLDKTKNYLVDMESVIGGTAYDDMSIVIEFFESE